MGLPIPKLLVVEDDPKTARSLVAGFEAEGFSAHAAQSGEDALLSLNVTLYELVILDWMLPGRDGLQVLRTIRERGDRVPVLLLTARDAVNDRVLGLEAGADDYLSKPFAFAELLARARHADVVDFPAAPHFCHIRHDDDRARADPYRFPSAKAPTAPAHHIVEENDAKTARSLVA